jgi:hypothetical protein
VPIATLIIGAIIGTASDNLLSPVFQHLSPVIPTLGEQIQSYLKSVGEEGTRQVIQQASTGYGEANIVLIAKLQILVYLAMLPLISLVPLAPLIFREPVKSKGTRILIVAIYVLLSGFFVHMAARESQDEMNKRLAMYMNKAYQRNITVLAPYLSDQEEELNSLWALMKEPADVQEIEKRISALAEKHGLAW